MKFLAIAALAFAMTAVVAGVMVGKTDPYPLAAVALLCAVATFQSQHISAFLKIFVGIFAVELVVFGGLYLISVAGLWPAALAEYQIPQSLPLTVALFAILVYAVSHIPLIRRIMNIADRYFAAPDRSPTWIWPFPIFIARERRVATVMVVFLVLINQAQVFIQVQLSFFSRNWFNAIQAKDAMRFWHELLVVFASLAFLYIASAVIEFVVQSTLVIKWRRWLTAYYTNRWLGDHNHYRMALAGGGADNPDQRISEDIVRFIDGGQVGSGVYNFTITLISQLSSLVSFAILLWGLSTDFTFPYTTFAIPGFLFWVALVYTGFGTIIAHLIGRPLADLSFKRQRYEADFRFSLARLREYSEQVALLRGEAAENASFSRRFAAIMSNYYDIITCRKWLALFTNFYGQVGPFIPYIVAAPFYFLGKIDLGIMTQTARAFSSVEASLNFFVTNYVSLADFKSVLDRLSSFDAAIERAESFDMGKGGVMRAAGDNGVAFEGVRLRLPDERPIVESDGLRLATRENALLTGSSGSGKSTLLRAISGIWPYAKGKIELPRDARIMLLPQRPYIPIGTLRAAVTYPAKPDEVDDTAIRAALTAAELGAFVDELDTEDTWAQKLSGGEQQRLAIARALLEKPDWLFLDEATAAMDEGMEEKIYKILREKLPDATIVSVGHRSSLTQFHKRHLAMTRGPTGVYSPRDVAQKAAE